MTDPIADMLTRIRNAVHQRHQRVDIPASHFKAEIARILEQEGYITGFKLVEPGEERPVIRLALKYGPRGAVFAKSKMAISACLFDESTTKPAQAVTATTNYADYLSLIGF